jgi:hypothetical protein
MVKNISQSVTAAFWQLSNHGTFDMAALQEQATKYFKAVQDKNEEAAAQEKAVLKALYSPEAAAALEIFGKDLHTDGIGASATLGSVLFDIYLSQAVEPTAPLLKHIHQKKIQEAASTLDAEEFDVPEYVKEAVQVILSDDEKWKKCAFTVLITNKDGGKHAITITPAGVQVYNQIMEALIALFT